jgi:hypothetical protein
LLAPPLEWGLGRGQSYADEFPTLLGVRVDPLKLPFATSDVLEDPDDFKRAAWLPLLTERVVSAGLDFGFCFAGPPP